MSTLAYARPEPEQLAEYHHRYLRTVPEGDVLALLESQIEDTLRLLRAQPETRGDHRYEPDKWCVKDVIGHLIDVERIFVFRALWFARGGGGELPGFDQAEFGRAGRFEKRTLASLADELEAVRRSTVAFFRGVDPEAVGRTGRASGYPVSARIAAFVLAGHERHHRGILIERYGLAD